MTIQTAMLLTNGCLAQSLFCQGRIPGHLASRDGSARDAGQMASIPGRPGQSGTGGNPISFYLSFLIQMSTVMVPSKSLTFEKV